ncbi:hypothetical protein AB0P15_30170 [Streptomyces sp. NPDC087917]|uniref:hypothetical protein n=1 Tax=Streptomyces sp. NPDC087917 TaxID=3155060 RepID=UPI003449E6CE
MTISFVGNFLTDDIWKRAHIQFLAADRAAEPKDAAWGLWDEDPQAIASVQDPLDQPLAAKLAGHRGVAVIVLGSYAPKPVGGTALLGLTESGEPEPLTFATAGDVRAWRERNPGGRFAVKVGVQAHRDMRHPGFLVEILTHELAAHVEPFVDFLNAEDILPGIATLASEEEQHAELHTGNARYRLIGASYLERFPEEGSGPEFCVRMQMDTVANATLPPGIGLVPARHRGDPFDQAGRGDSV